MGNKSLASNSMKKKKILIGCAIGGTALIMAGAGIGIGYAFFHRDSTPPVDNYQVSTNNKAALMDTAPTDKIQLSATKNGAPTNEISYSLEQDEEWVVINEDTNEIEWASGHPALTKTEFVTILSKVNGKTIDTRQIALTQGAPTAEKSLSAWLNNNSAKADQTGSVEVHVTCYNGASKPTDITSLNGFTGQTSWSDDGTNGWKSTLTYSGTTAGPQTGTVTNGTQTTTVSITVAPVDPTKSFSAWLNNNTAKADGTGSVEVHVTCYNGANKPTDITSLNGFTGQTSWSDDGTNGWKSTLTYSGTTAGPQTGTVTNGTQTTTVSITVAPDTNMYDWEIRHTTGFFDTNSLQGDIVEVAGSSLQWTNAYTYMFLDLEHDPTYTNNVTLTLPTSFRPTVQQTITAFFQITGQTNFVQDDLAVNTNGTIVFTWFIQSATWSNVVFSGAWVSNTTPPGQQPAP